MVQLRRPLAGPSSALASPSAATRSQSPRAGEADGSATDGFFAPFGGASQDGDDASGGHAQPPPTDGADAAQAAPLDTFALTPAPRTATSHAIQVGNVELAVRGTRASDGSSGRGVTLGQGPVAHDAHVAVTTFGITAKAPVGDDSDLRLSMDRSSLRAGAAVPTADGGNVTLSAGAITTLGYASATVHDANGNGIGPALMATPGGTPGLGMTYTHVGAAGGTAVAPTVLADKVQLAEVAGPAPLPHAAAGRGGDGADAAAVQDAVKVVQTRTASVFGMLVVSGGSHGFAGVGRASGEIKTSKRYSQNLPTNEAYALTQKQNLWQRRLRALGAGNKRAIPTTDAPERVAAGASLQQDRAEVLALSLGVSVAGVQLNGARIDSTRTFGEVARPDAAGQASSTPGLDVAVGHEQARTHLFAADFPLLGAVSLARSQSEHQAFGYTVADDAAARDLLRRKRNFLGRKAHYSVPATLEADAIAAPEFAMDQLHALREVQPDLQRISVHRARGGRTLRAALLPLPGAILGPKASFSFEREINGASLQIEATPAQSTVVRAAQNRTQYELPFRGKFGRSASVMQVAALQASPRAGVAPTEQKVDLVQVGRTYSHAGRKALQEISRFIREIAPEQAPKQDADFSFLEKEVDVSVDVRLQLTAEVGRAFARVHGGFGQVPAEDADALRRADFHAALLKALPQSLGDGSSPAAIRLIAALRRHGAVLQVQTHTDAIDAALTKASKTQVKLASLKQADAGAVLNTVAPALRDNRRLEHAWKLLNTWPLNLVPADKQRQRKQQVRRAREALTPKLFTMPTLINLSDEQQAFDLYSLRNLKALKSPELHKAGQGDLFAQAMAEALTA